MRTRPSSFKVHSFYAYFLLEYVRKHGGDADALKRRFVLPEPTGELPGLSVPFAILPELSLAAEAMLGDPFLGLNIACSLERGSYGILEVAVCSAPTLAAALDQFLRYARAVLPRVEFFALQSAEQGTLFIHRFPIESMPNLRHQNEFLLANVTLFFRQLAGPDWAPQRVTFGHAAPAERGELERVFGTAALHFGCADNSILFDCQSLERKLSTADANFLPILDRQAQRIMKLYTEERPDNESPDDRLVEQIRHQLQKQLSRGAPNLDEVAKALHMSARTLQRRLAAMELRFADVLDKLRLELAQRYLQDRKLALGEITFLLGYSEPRAFVRAYKGWTGVTPGRYRQQMAT